ncbi:rhomboid family intramembrane serine protease [Nocardioides alcanivorans]|uniref:rhomboid family intramembrane serine protease n=1 Tax=Nocardioides alcanivorans TaxID=2897352 RepID=UPI001F416778|nr:rhomboid family intramembrane serine protease [Nocardioides alcanivorans]
MSLPELNEPEARGSRVSDAALVIGVFVGVLWVLEIVDTILNNRLDRLGIEPLQADGLWGILFAPLLHSGFGHLIANTIPALVLGFLILLSGGPVWARATGTIWLIGGVGTWLTGGANTLHLGASVLIFGWLTFLLLRGFFNRNVLQILLGLVVFVIYGGVLWGVLPTTPGVSWQGHLFGAIGGGLAAFWMAEREKGAETRA